MNETNNKLCMGCMNPDTGNPCPYCGFDKNLPHNNDYLKPGTHLDSRYLVGKLEKFNGEGATYLGYDLSINKAVWVREYFPSSIATRNTETGEIMPTAGSGAQYKALLADFVELCNEVRRFSVSDPVVPVENMIGENNTIYVVYKHLDVITLEEFLIAKGGRLSYQDATDLLIPLLNAVDNIHMQGIIHRGLSPHTVLVDNKEKLYIDAFSLSAARTGGSELKAEFFNGYSAPEQYVSTGWQGTWTDVYALSTIFYRTISGVVPPKSTRINAQSPLSPLSVLVPGVPQKISDAVENGMKILAQERTQTVVGLLGEIVAEDGVENTAVFDPGRSIPTTIPTEKFDFFSDDDARGYGQTEEISSHQDFQEFKSDFRSSQNQPPVRQPSTTNFAGRPEMASQSAEGEDKPRGFNRMYIILASVAVILVGAIIAIVISGKLDLTAKPDKSSSNGISTSFEPDGESAGPGLDDDDESSESSESKEDDLVPNFIGREISVVQYHKDYADRYTFVIEEEFSEKWDEGIITAQSVKEGSKIVNKSKITLTVSKGPHVMDMPDLRGMEVEEALQELARSIQILELEIEDLEIDEYIKKIDDTVPEGTVIATYPVQGQKFNPKETKIQITIAESSPVSESSKASSSSKPASSKPPISILPESSKGDDEVDGDINTPSKR